MRLALVLGTLGKLLQVFALAFLAPAALAVWDASQGGAWDGAWIFGGSFVVTGLAGLAASRWFESQPNLLRSEALAIVAGAWFVVAHFSALPYWALGMDYFDGFFESMSGLTTTGATVFTTEDFASTDRATFLWRSITHWIGGLGVIALFVVVLPQLGVAGRQILFAESSTATTEIVSPHFRSTARRLWVLYSGLTIAEILALVVFTPMQPFHAICNSMATTAAGGFSPHPLSIMGYQSPAAEWIITLFMVLAGISFPLLWVGLFRRPREFWRDGEFRVYLGALVILALGIAAIRAGGFPGEDALRDAFFNSASAISSTGFATSDWNVWPQSAQMLLVLTMLVCSCAGSTGGGPKVVRLVLAFKHMHRELVRVLHPRGVLPIRHKGKPIPEEAMRTILAIVAVYFLGQLALGTLLTLLGTPMVTSFTAAVACVNNIGPGLAQAGPMENYSFLDPASTILCSIGMWLGRLEFVTVLVLLHPDVLRKVRWRRESPAPGAA